MNEEWTGKCLRQVEHIKWSATDNNPAYSILFIFKEINTYCKMYNYRLKVRNVEMVYCDFAFPIRSTGSRLEWNLIYHIEIFYDFNLDIIEIFKWFKSWFLISDDIRLAVSKIKFHLTVKVLLSNLRLKYC